MNGGTIEYCLAGLQHGDQSGKLIGKSATSYEGAGERMPHAKMKLRDRYLSQQIYAAVITLPN